MYSTSINLSFCTFLIFLISFGNCFCPQSPLLLAVLSYFPPIPARKCYCAPYLLRKPFLQNQNALLRNVLYFSNPLRRPGARIHQNHPSACSFYAQLRTGGKLLKLDTSFPLVIFICLKVLLIAPFCVALHTPGLQFCVIIVKSTLSSESVMFVFALLSASFVFFLRLRVFTCRFRL